MSNLLQHFINSRLYIFPLFLASFIPVLFDLFILELAQLGKTRWTCMSTRFFVVNGEPGLRKSNDFLSHYSLLTRWSPDSDTIYTGMADFDKKWARYVGQTSWTSGILYNDLFSIHFGRTENWSLKSPRFVQFTANMTL